MVSAFRLTVFISLLVVAPAMAQSSDTSQQRLPVLPPPGPSGILLSMSRCATTADSPALPFDALGRNSARKSIGRATIRFLGREFPVFGRLIPSTNIAAQISALDSAIVGRAMIDPAGSGYGYERVPRRRSSRLTLSAPLAAPSPLMACESP
jgi:hypothetical protein